MPNPANGHQMWIDKYALATENTNTAVFGLFGEKDSSGLGHTGLINPHFRVTNDLILRLSAGNSYIIVGVEGEAPNVVPSTGDVITLTNGASVIQNEVIVPSMIVPGQMLVPVGDTLPSTGDATEGDLFYRRDIVNNVFKLHYFDGTAWQEFGSGGGGGGITDVTATSPLVVTNPSAGVKNVEIPNGTYATPASVTAVQTELDTHEAATGNVHGLTLANLTALGVATDADLDTHTAATGNVHGLTLANLTALGVATDTDLDNHVAATGNVHGLTLANLTALGVATDSDLDALAAQLASGTTVPTSPAPANGDKFYLSDISAHCVYDTRFNVGSGLGIWCLDEPHINDDFNRANSSTVGRSPKSGYSYDLVDGSSSLSIVSNKLEMADSAGFLKLTTMLGADFAMQVTVNDLFSLDWDYKPGLALARDGFDLRILVLLGTQGGATKVMVCTQANGIEASANVTLADNTDYVLTATIRNNVVNVWVDGVQYITNYAITDANHVNMGTRWVGPIGDGMLGGSSTRSGATTSVKFDNLLIRRIPSEL
jgi:hypothetical protein